MRHPQQPRLAIFANPESPRRGGGLIAGPWWYNERGLMNDWRSKTGKHAERAKQASLEAYRKALKSIRTRAPGWRAKLPSDRVGGMRVGLVALAVFLALVVSGAGVVAGIGA